ncbi:hypothetical protein ACFQ1R_06780 [Mariniflexile jejuense]|uniref:Transglutaminase superfamily protein n=1 Tax=Mariniflexile jejuense TaxID=1173582 RepID=A0ABW3JJQ9_9FLAO
MPSYTFNITSKLLSLQNLHYFLLFLVLSSCSLYAQTSSNYTKSVNLTLSKAGNNKAEFIKVLEHFKSDTLKFKAASSLISNISFHSFKNNYEDYNDLIDFLHNERLKQMEDGIEEKKIRDFVRKTFEKASASVYQLNRGKKHALISDIDILKSDFLIENIELAFEAHNKLPKKYQSNFEDFVKYVLPYRVSSEPLELTKRKELYKKYSWVYDSLKTKPLDIIIERIYDDLNLDGGQSLLKKLNGLLSLTQIEKLQFGRCDDIVNYFVMLFRSLGFAAGEDYISHWGNFHHASGHAWVFLKIKDETFPIQVSVDSYSNSTSKKIFMVGSMPKIFRNNFIKIDEETLELLPIQDVTYVYRLTSNVHVKNSFESNFNEDFKLCVYDNQKQWAIVDDNYTYSNETVTFNNVGRGILYSIAILENKDLKLINYPFYLDFKGNLIMLDNKSPLNKTSFVLRKYPPFFPHINVKLDRLKTLNYCKIQGSNTLDDQDFNDIYKIENFCTSQKIKFYFNEKQKYKYYRLISDNDVLIQLANFNLLDEHGKPFENLDLAYNGLETTDRLFKVLDDDPLTYIEYKNLNIAFEISKNQFVSGFQIQARNDDNHINIGEEYEFMQYDKGWKSIRKEIANDTVLKYDNLPKNGLYILKNLTKGKEENVFSFDSAGNQFWFGVSDINEILEKVEN